jgi:ribosomal protein S12 methylthiotransferase
MKRRVTRKQIETLLQKLRDWIPGMTLRTTFIAGSPGETEEQHRELVDFVRDFGFDMMGVFPYSAEPGTAMGRMTDQVPDEVKKQRVEELMLAQQEIAFAKVNSMQGRTMDVLIDRRAGRDVEDGWVGRHTGQAPDIDSITLVRAEDLHAGQMVNVRVSGADGYDVLAEPVRKAGRGLTVLKA